MSFAQKIAKNTMSQLMGKVVSTILGLVSIGILARYLGTEKFGWYVTASGFLQFVGILVDGGFTLTTTNLLAEEKFDETKVLQTIFTWRFFSALFFHSAALLIFLFFSYPTPIKQAVAIASVSFFALSLNQVFIGYYQAKLKNYLQMFAEVLGRVCLLLGILIFSITKQGFLIVMAGITFSTVISTVYFFLTGPKLRFSFDKKISAAILKKTWPLAIAIIFNAIYFQGDRLILPFFVSQSEVGLYGAAYKVLDFVIQSAALLMGIMLPILTNQWAKKNYVEFKKYLDLSFELLALFLIPSLIGAIVLNTPIMQLVGGKAFSGSGAILSALSFAIAGICLGMVGGHTMLALNKQKQSVYIFASDAVLSLIGYLYFIPRNGIMGAAWVTIFSEWYAGLLLCFLASYYSKSLPPFKILLKILLSSLAMGVIVFSLQPLSLILSFAVAGITYIAFIFILKVVSLKTVLKIIFSRSNIVDPIVKTF
jgi:O-antigen/teichoic acid export membrane protein